MNKAICGSKESAAPNDELETWKEMVLLPTLARYSPRDIYNGDETALFYKLLPHRTYCFDSDKPAGSAKCKDRLTLLIITNMDGSDHRKLSVIGKSKTPCCLHKKYKIQVKDMSVDWYASKIAWMTGEIHHQIMVTMLLATRFESVPTSSSSCYCNGFEITSASNTWLRMIYCLQIIWWENRKFQWRSWSVTILHSEDMVQAGCD